MASTANADNVTETGGRPGRKWAPEGHRAAGAFSRGPRWAGGSGPAALHALRDLRTGGAAVERRGSWGYCSFQAFKSPQARVQLLRNRLRAPSRKPCFKVMVRDFKIHSRVPETSSGSIRAGLPRVEGAASQGHSHWWRGQRSP